MVGETSSGKTTQVPQFLHEAGWSDRKMVIACTQPRRVAAMTVAQRVAEEMGVPLGAEVGYAVRFEEACDPEKVRIKYLTDGVLLREMMSDPLLSRYSVIMVDEAHERSQQTDLLLGLLKKVRRKRPDLRLVISSATIDAELFREYFREPPSRTESGAAASTSSPSGDPAVLSVQGRTYAVQLHYLASPCSSYVNAAVETALKLHGNDGAPGDVLVFLTGQEECETAVQRIHADSRAKQGRSGGRSSEVLAVALYAGLPRDAQAKVFEPTPAGFRKVIFATNVAETSITLEGVSFVIDCCFSKQRFFDPITGLESLLVCPISKQSAAQRAGRAGRVRPGHCFRLCTEEDYLQLLPDQTLPEMQRSELSGVLMQLKALGIDNLLSFDFLSAPPSQSVVRALESLHALGAIDGAAKLTKALGTLMCELPLAPPMAKAVLAGAAFGCLHEILTIAAMTSVQTYWATRAYSQAAQEAKDRFSVAEGDLVTCLNVWRAWNEAGRNHQWSYTNFVHHKSMIRVAFVREQLYKQVMRMKLPVKSSQGDLQPVRRALTCGLFANAAVLVDGAAPDGPHDVGAVYRLVREAGGGSTSSSSAPVLRIHPSSVLYKCKPTWVLFYQVQQASTGAFEMQDLVTIEPDWLPELAPHYFERKGINPHLSLAEQFRTF